MSEYIEREALKEIFTKNYSSEYPSALVLAIIDNQPAADVAEVKHGKWLDCIETGISPAGIKVTGMTGYKCSLCGRYEGKKEPYCNCGAKMNKE